MWSCLDVLEGALFCHYSRNTVGGTGMAKLGTYPCCRTNLWPCTTRNDTCCACTMAGHTCMLLLQGHASMSVTHNPSWLISTVRCMPDTGDKHRKNVGGGNSAAVRCMHVCALPNGLSCTGYACQFQNHTLDF